MLFSVPSDILELIISGDGTTVAGNAYEIICRVEKIIDGLLYSPNATWTIEEEERDDIIINSFNSSTSLLGFRLLKTSHAGIYTCQGTILFVAHSEPYSILKRYNLTVQSKSTIFTSIMSQISVHYLFK